MVFVSCWVAEHGAKTDSHRGPRFGEESSGKVEGAPVLEVKIISMQTAGGVFLPDANLPKMNEAEVIAVGPGLKDTDGA